MYLLEKEYEFFKDPWPHIVINNVFEDDVAEYMLQNFPKPGMTEKEVRQNKFIGYYDDPVFKEFHEENISREKEFHRSLNDIFGNNDEDLYSTRYSFKRSDPNDEFVVLKDWHTDSPNKKYKVLIYLGSGNGGWLEMANPETREIKRYNYQHNRLVIYENTELSFHRFYSSDQPRYTIGFSVKHSSAEKKNYGNKYNHLQMKSNIW